MVKHYAGQEACYYLLHTLLIILSFTIYCATVTSSSLLVLYSLLNLDHLLKSNYHDFSLLFLLLLPLCVFLVAVPAQESQELLMPYMLSVVKKVHTISSSISLLIFLFVPLCLYISNYVSIYVSIYLSTCLCICVSI